MSKYKDGGWYSLEWEKDEIIDDILYSIKENIKNGKYANLALLKEV